MTLDNITREKLEILNTIKETPGDKKITFKLSYGKTQKKVLVQPVSKEGSTVRFHGIPLTTEEKAKYNGYTPTHEDFVWLTNGKTFDLNDPVEEAIVNWLIYSPVIGTTREKVHEQRVDFYIDMPEQETRSKISIHNKRMNAYNYVQGLTADDQRNVCKILGIYSEGFSGNDVEAQLFELANENPESLLNVKNDRDFEVKILFYTLKEKGLIKNENGVFLIAESIAGTSIESALGWLKHSDNAALVEILKKEAFATNKKKTK
jgi:hypothetical protein